MNYKADPPPKKKKNFPRGTQTTDSGAWQGGREGKGSLPEWVLRYTKSTEHQIPNGTNCPCEAAGEGSRVRGYWIQSDGHGRGNCMDCMDLHWELLVIYKYAPLTLLLSYLVWQIELPCQDLWLCDITLDNTRLEWSRISRDCGLGY